MSQVSSYHRDTNPDSSTGSSTLVSTGSSSRTLRRPSTTLSEPSVTDGSNTKRRASGSTRLTPSGAQDTPSGISTRRLLIYSNTFPSPTWSSSREISTTENSLTIVTLHSTHRSPSPSVPSLPSQEHLLSPRCEPSSRTLSSVSHRVLERSSTRRSLDGRSLENTYVFLHS